jgi:hypothetical protein
MTIPKSRTPAPPPAGGLDWDALTPTCPGCGTRSGSVTDGGCAHCNPEIAKAAAETRRRLTRPAASRSTAANTAKARQQAEEWWTLYNGGLTLDAIAEQADVSRETIRRTLVAAGYELRRGRTAA